MELTIPDMASVQSVTFVQEPDSCEGRDEEYQGLSVFLDDAGGGHFVRLSTDRWSIDDVDQFAETLKQLIEQADAWNRGISERDSELGQARI